MTDNLTLNMDAYLPLRDVVFNTLREAILKGELKPGERLMAVSYTHLLPFLSRHSTGMHLSVYLRSLRTRLSSSTPSSLSLTE